MADSNDVPARDDAALAIRPRTRRTGVISRASARVLAPAKTAATRARSTSSASSKRSKRSAMKPVRSVAILTVVTGLVATVALPAYGVWQSETDAVSIQQVAAEGAQTLVVASEADAPGLARESYSATTSGEIDDEIAKEEAAEAAAERARQASAASSGSSSLATDYAMAPGTGAVRWPLGDFTLGDGFGARGGAHMGIDMLAGGGTPIYAAADGVVRVSQESYGGYGVAVTIDSVVGGQRITTLYGHMIYGSRKVGVGQTVQAGQVIGLVGSTGRSTANHLHFEVYLNGSNIDPWAWLQSNAG